LVSLSCTLPSGSWTIFFVTVVRSPFTTFVMVEQLAVTVLFVLEVVAGWARKACDSI